DMELGEMLLVLDDKKDAVSFFHSYDTGEKKITTQIWIRRSNDFCTFKVQECSKGLNAGEQMVLATLLRHMIVMMSLSF
ncbi:hypothetical protein GOV07_03760, partial [Candidatus Woesearchaeota archaeon]|nr:hypothetical protein [Candidatus Woesearchaeota archaeon]